MSKAFTKETDQDDDEPEKPEGVPLNGKNYVTPFGFNALQNKLQHLSRKERPPIVETVSWAAKNGDRSENGDYIYGKRRLREIDRRIRYLTKRIKSAVVVDPALQQSLTKVFFGATVTYLSVDKHEKVTIQIVGVDEADIAKGKISWISPLAKTLLKSEVNDTRALRTPSHTEKIKILKIVYLITNQ